jgi:hypothetical protein
MAKLFAQIAGPRTYFVEKILTIGLAYVLALWILEIGLAVVAINLLRFSFSTRPDDLERA